MQNLESQSLLIIEDEPLVAFTLRDMLEDAGFQIVGIAQRLNAAMAWIKKGGFDAAIIDANLAGESTGPAAAQLRASNIPFVVLSGYSADQLRDVFPGAEILRKPCLAVTLAGALRKLNAANPPG